MNLQPPYASILPPLISPHHLPSYLPLPFHQPTITTTGAGKTHTMLGKDEYPGIMAHSLTDLFEKMSQNQDSNSYNVTMSYLEVRRFFGVVSLEPKNIHIHIYMYQTYNAL